MSLRDTIDGARKEALENAVGLPKKEAEALGDDDKRGFSRKSAAHAKPVREAAASVRVASKPKPTNPLTGGKKETKEEKRERKRREREEEDVRNRAFDIVIRSMPGYQKTEKIFWGVLAAGMVMAVLSLIAANILGEQTDLTTWEGALSVGLIVVAYACIIGAFIFDLVKRRPFRKQAEAIVRGLSEKKLASLFAKDQAALAEEQEKRKKK